MCGSDTDQTREGRPMTPPDLPTSTDTSSTTLAFDPVASTEALTRLEELAAALARAHQGLPPTLPKGAAGRGFAAYEKALGEVYAGLHERTAAAFDVLSRGVTAALRQVEELRVTDEAHAASTRAIWGRS